uniref:Uncharacterized protein n=1 Tax=viral metagenome TaxID=1070528 RepID=A0A6C0BQD6_9ZZZZ
MPPKKQRTGRKTKAKRKKPSRGTPRKEHRCLQQVQGFLEQQVARQYPPGAQVITRFQLQCGSVTTQLEVNSAGTLTFNGTVWTDSLKALAKVLCKTLVRNCKHMNVMYSQQIQRPVQMMLCQ